MRPIIALLFGFAATLPLQAARYAIIFGTNYTGNTADIPPLHLCEADARLMERTLRDQGQFTDARVLLGTQVTASAIQSTLAEFGRKVGGNDTVVIYFSGHGTTQYNASTRNKTENTLIMFNRPHVTDDTLNGWVKQIRSKKTVLIFDACYSGGIAGKGNQVRGAGDIPVPPGESGTIIQDGDEDSFFQGKAIIGSSGHNETSIEIGGMINHGIFTYYFSQGLSPRNGDLNGDGTVTVLEAFEWSRTRVSDHARRVNHVQNPQISGNASGIFISGNITPAPIAPPQPPVIEAPLPPPSPQGGTVVIETVDPSEPQPTGEGPQGNVEIITTVFESTVAGPTTLDPREALARNKLPNESRKVKVLLSEQEYPATIRWLSQSELKALTGETIPLGTYTWRANSRANKVAMLQLTGVPAGIHEVELLADGYPRVKSQLGVEAGGKNQLLIVTSMAKYGTIRGKVFFRNFGTPMRNHPVWMPQVRSPNQIFKMNTTADGSFWFLNLPPASDYYIKPSILEDTPLGKKKIQVKAGQVTDVDVILTKAVGR